METASACQPTPVVEGGWSVGAKYFSALVVYVLIQHLNNKLRIPHFSAAQIWCTITTNYKLSLRVESESTKTLLWRGSTGHRVTSHLLPNSGSFTDVRSQYLLSIAGIVNICPWLLFTLITSLFRQKLSSAGDNQEILFSSYLGTLKSFQNDA